MYSLKLFLSFVFVTVSIFATADGPDYFSIRGVAYNDVLWIHPRPDHHSTRIKGIPSDASCIKNLGCSGKWCKVSYGGVTGWVNGRYLGEGDCLKSQKGNNSSSTPTFQIAKVSWGACMLICEDVPFCKKANYNKNNGQCTLELNSNQPRYLELQRTCPKRYWNTEYSDDRWNIVCSQ
jgi:hypothetical protein